MSNLPGIGGWFGVGPVIAEEMLLRGPLSGRGIVALAVVSWCAAAIVIVCTLLRSRRAFADPPTAPDLASPLMRTRALMGEAPFRLLQVLLGVLFVVTLGASLGIASRPAPVLPPGWTVLVPQQEVASLEVSGDVLWMGGIAGLSAINRQTRQVQPLPAGTPEFRYVRDLLVDRDGALWVAHGKGIARFSAGQWTTFSAADGLAGGAGLGLALDHAGVIWTGTDRGVFKYEGRTFTQALTGFAANVVFEAGNGVMWFGSDDPEHGGLRSFDGRAWTDWTPQLAHRSVNAVVEDRHGALWFATGFSSSGGATRLDRGTWTTWTRNEGLAGGKVRSVFEDAAGRLWFGSEYDGIAVTDGRQWRVLKPDDGMAGVEVKQMVQDSDGVYWLGTETGLSRIEHFEFGR